MKIILTTTNKAKNEALQKTLKKLSIDANVISLKVETGVSKTPTTDEEGIIGAINRIKNAKEAGHEADIYIGMEGIIETNEFGTFICGWTVIESKEGRRSMGCSAKVELPNKLAKKVSNLEELSDLVKNNYKSNLVNKIDSIGSNGIITNNLYTRVDEFEDSLMCAFGYFINNENYSE